MPFHYGHEDVRAKAEQHWQFSPQNSGMRKENEALQAPIKRSTNLWHPGVMQQNACSASNCVLNVNADRCDQEKWLSCGR